MESPSPHRGHPAILALNFLCLAAFLGSAQNAPPAKIDVMVVPDIAMQTKDYADARKTFHTDLLRKGPAPHQQDCKDSKPPVGVSEVYFLSGELHLRAWLNHPDSESKKEYPAVLFLDG